MSEFKLEVGKTYRNRKGEEVKITGCYGGYCQPYKGTNGEWYTESGKRGCASKENPEDLIEEVTATRHTFEIPDGMKKVTVEQVGNRIVVEIVPEAPKPGDVMINDGGSVYIFKEVVNDCNHGHYAWLGEDGRLSVIGRLCNPGRLATPEEAQPLWDALKKAGKRWNPEAMRVEDVPEKEPKPGDVLVNEQGSVYIFKEVDGKTHKHYCAWLGGLGHLAVGGFCIPGRPATPEEAQPLFDALKKAGKRWNAETMQVEDVPEICRIREWVENNLSYGHHTKEGIAEAIEGYLKHREGEK